MGKEMNDEIKSRIENLIGKPSFAFCDDDSDKLENWQNWHEALIKRLAKNAISVAAYQHQLDDSRGNTWIARQHMDADSTHSALLLDIQPIKRGVTKKEIVEYLRSATWYSERLKLAERIECEGIASE